MRVDHVTVRESYRGSGECYRDTDLPTSPGDTYHVTCFDTLVTKPALIVEFTSIPAPANELVVLV